MKPSEWLALGAGVTAVLVVGWLLKRGAQEVANGLDPTSDKNIAYRAANKVGAAVTANPSFSLGVWLWEITHADEVERSRRIGTEPGKAQGRGASGTW